MNYFCLELFTVFFQHENRFRYKDVYKRQTDGRGTISVSKTMQRANKDALEKLDPKQVYYTFPDRREGSKSSLIQMCIRDSYEAAQNASQI